MRRMSRLIGVCGVRLCFMGWLRRGVRERGVRGVGSVVGGGGRRWRWFIFDLGCC